MYFPKCRNCPLSDSGVLNSISVASFFSDFNSCLCFFFPSRVQPTWFLSLSQSTARSSEPLAASAAASGAPRASYKPRVRTLMRNKGSSVRMKYGIKAEKLRLRSVCFSNSLPLCNISINQIFIWDETALTSIAFYTQSWKWWSIISPEETINAAAEDNWSYHWQQVSAARAQNRMINSQTGRQKGINVSA